jgi:hypothetical protein
VSSRTVPAATSSVPSKRSAFADGYGNSGYYVPVQESAVNNWKLKAFGSGEHRCAPFQIAGVIIARKLLQAAVA